MDQSDQNMKFDTVLSHLGEFGRYQKRIYFLLCLPAISCAMHKLAWVFLGARVDHRCLLPHEFPNASYALPPEEANMSYPWDSLAQRWSQCDYLDANYSQHYFMSGVPATNTKSCHTWVYDRSRYQSSAVIDWDLVCDRSVVHATAQALFMVGVLLGSVIFGDLSDRFGRRPVFFASLVLQVLCGILAGLAPEYISFVIIRLLVGASTSGVFLVAYVIGVELVGPNHRLFTGVVCQIFFSAGYMVTALFAYLIQDWKMLQIALSLPGLLFLCYWWFVPESIRWLMSQGRNEEAVVLIRRAAAENKVSMPEEVYESIIKSESKEEAPAAAPQAKASILDLLRTPNMRKKSLNIFFNWFVNSGVYYGLSLNTSNLGGNDYLNFLISGAVEVPAYVMLILTLNRWGRKYMLCGNMLFGGLVLLLTLAVPDNLPSLTISLAMLGKMAITASYGIIYIFSAEHFPTVVRNVGLGASSTCARVGGILAPFVLLLADHWRPFPLIIFGGLSFMAGLLALMLPETLNRKLPETIEDGEKFGPRPLDDDEKPAVVNGLVGINYANEKKGAKGDSTQAAVA